MAALSSYYYFKYSGVTTFFFFPSHDRALTDAVYKKKLAPVCPV